MSCMKVNKLYITDDPTKINMNLIFLLHRQVALLAKCSSVLKLHF